MGRIVVPGNMHVLEGRQGSGICCIQFDRRVRPGRKVRFERTFLIGAVQLPHAQTHESCDSHQRQEGRKQRRRETSVSDAQGHGAFAVDAVIM
jgi:hypothetical protein